MSNLGSQGERKDLHRHLSLTGEVYRGSRRDSQERYRSPFTKRVRRFRLPLQTPYPYFYSTYLGLGILNIVLSMMPQRLISVIELFGIKGTLSFLFRARLRDPHLYRGSWRWSGATHGLRRMGHEMDRTRYLPG